MNTGLTLTFDLLASTPNTASLEILTESFEQGEQDIRQLAIQSMLDRDDEESFDRVISLWSEFDTEERQQIGEAGQNLKEHVVEKLERSDDEYWIQCVEIVHQLNIFRGLPNLIRKSENAADDNVRMLAIATVLDLTGQMGKHARQSSQPSRDRTATVARLAKSIESFEFHRCRELVDAFLSAVTWGEPALRSVFSENPESVALICDRFRKSKNLHVIDLLAGWVCKPQIPDPIVAVLKSRKDHRFRDALLQHIGRQPSRSACRNLRELSELSVISNIVNPMTELNPEQQSAYLVAIEKLNYNEKVVRRTAVQMIESSDEQAIVAACEVLRRLGPISIKQWQNETLRLVDLLESDATPEMLATSFLWRHIQLLDYPSKEVRDVARTMLEYFTATQFFDQFEVSMAKRFVPAIKLIDPDVQQLIIDDLKHPTMERRVRALDMAIAFEMIDSLLELLRRRFEDEHLEIKIKITEALALAVGRDARKWLGDLTQSSSGPIRDAALRAHQQRAD